MNAEQIATALRKEKSYRGIHKIILQIDQRRQAINARIPEIDYPLSPAMPVSVTRQAAIDAGPAKVAELDKEIEALHAELDYLAQLDQRATVLWSEAECREFAEKIPGCLSRLSKAQRRVREALAKLDEELEALRETVEPIANYEKAGIPFPLSDTECGQLLQLRLDVWQPRTVMAVAPPDMDVNSRDQFPESWPRTFRRRNGHRDTWVTRKAPQFVEPIDFLNEL